MKSLPSIYKYAGRPLMALAAIASILLMAACSSGNGQPPINTVGFNNASLTGTYVFSSQGVDSLYGAPLALAGTLVANGTGGITGGTIDAVDPEVAPVSPVAQPITGSYGVGADGRGRASLTSTMYGTFILDFVLTSTSHGLVTEFDGNGTGSGTIDLQTAITNLTQLAGPYAFSLAGADSNGASFATAGAFTLGSNGSSTAGIEDFNDDGTQFAPGNLTASVALGSGTGPGPVTLNANFGPLLFDFYPIDATHFKLIETDYVESLAGDVFTQTGASIPNGPMVFTMSGGINAPVANGGVMTSDGTGNFPTGLEDLNNDGLVESLQPFSGALNAGASGPTGGRVVVTLSGFSPAIQWVVYPSSGGLLMLETDQVSVTTGVGLAQPSGAALGAALNYGFNLTAFNIENDYYENDIAQFLTATSAINGAVDISDDYGVNNGGVLLGSQGLGGTYTAGASGTGVVSTTTAGSAYVTFNYYGASNDTFLALETDSVQVGAGILQLQSPPSGSVAQSRIALAHPTVLRPAARARVAARSKKAPADR